MNEPLLTCREVADLFKCSPRSLGNPAWRRSIGLPAIKLGRGLRFRPADVEACMEKRREVLEAQRGGMGPNHDDAVAT